MPAPAFRGAFLCCLGVALALSPRAWGQTTPIRLAIGPYFHPVAAESLRSASQALPELLAVELSHEPRFQLVDRDKVQALLSELNLSAAGFASRQSMARVGQVLSCDWLVTGSLVQTDLRTVAWTKVIQVRSGVVLDLQAVPVNPDSLSLTVSNITRFLAGAGMTEPSRPRQFISLGRVVDMRPWLSTAREDWSRRMAATIERQCHADGYGVVEMEAVTPLFEERRLAAAAGQTDEPVKLQPAFWLIDGGCKWLEERPEKLEIGLRVQRVGGREQIIKFTTLPGEPAERAILEHLRQSLADTNRVAPGDETRAEVELMTRRGEELSNLRLPFMLEPRPGGFSGDKRLEQVMQMVERGRSIRENARRAVATFERTLLLEPTNYDARINLAHALMAAEDPAQRARGKEMLIQGAASNDPQWSAIAKSHLDRSSWLLREAERSIQDWHEMSDWVDLEMLVDANPSDWEAKLRLGILLQAVDHGQRRARSEQLLQEVLANANETLAARAREKLPTNSSPAIAAKARYDAGVRLIQSESLKDRERAMRLLSDVTNGPLPDLKTLAAGLLPPPGTPLADYRPKPIETVQYAEYSPTVCAVAPRFSVVGGVPPFDLWAAAGSMLYHYEMRTAQFEVVQLEPPLPPSTSITALNFGSRSVWVGTAGGGLLQLSRAGAFVKRLGTEQGLPGLFVRSVACFGGRVWIGFATSEKSDQGGLGYLDVETESFTALTPPALMASGQELPDGPPAHPVTAIKTIADSTLWALTDSNVKRYDIQENRWSQALPFSPRSFSVATNFLTATSPTGAVLVCRLPGTAWKPIRVANGPDQNHGALRNEGQRTWLGGLGKIRHLDLATETVIGGMEFDGGEVRWLFPREGLSYFIADGATNRSSVLYRFDRRPRIILHARE